MLGIAILKLYQYGYIFFFFLHNSPFSAEVSTRKMIFKNQVFAEINIHKLYIRPTK